MPRFDGTGPWGRGARTGWGLGPCGLGLRRGLGRGYGRGYGSSRWTQQDERTALEEEIKILKAELREAESLIQDIGTPKKKS